MTFIRKMVCTGFKSFRKRTIINFDKGFTAIVGANGSGKSNIIDAFSFVLGELSSKTLRANNTRDLISNGGRGLEPAQTATVEIIFDNTDNAFSIDTPEVSIMRKVNRKGQGVYKINGNRSTRKNIVNMLDLAGFLPNSSNMIMQGELFRLINMTANERRELIEEIAGIASYNAKKLTAEDELKEVQTNLGQISLLLNEVYDQLEQLEKEKNDAEKYLELENQEKVHSNAFYRVRAQEAENSIQDMKEKQNQITLQIQKIEEKEKSLHAEIAQFEQEIETLVPQLKKVQDDELLKLTYQLKSVKDAITEQNASIKYATQSFHDTQRDLEAMQQKITELNREEEQVLQEIEMLDSKRAGLQDHIFTSEDKIENYEAELSKIDAEFIQIKKEARELQEKIDEFKEIKASYSTEKKVAEQQLSTLEARKTTLENQIFKYLQEMERCKAEIEELKQQQAKQLGLSDLGEFSKENIEEKIEEIEGMIVAWQRDLKNLKPQLLAGQQQVFEMQSKIKLSKEVSRKDQTAGILRQLRSKSGISGIFGSIAELGRAKPKFSKALEMAVGSRFNYIVVDNQATGEKCIHFIKKEKLGRASFIPLDEIKYSPFNYQIPRDPKIYGRAVDLIEFDQKYFHAFEYIFGRIIIVDDIPTARFLQVPAKRVTLEGDIVDGSNLMTGGHHRRSLGLGFVSDKAAESDLQRLKQNLAEIQSKEMQLAANIKNSQQEISRLYKIKISGANKTKEYSEKIAVLRAKIAQLKDSIKQNEEEIGVICNQIQQLKTQQTQLEKQSEANADALTQQLAQLEAIQDKLDSSEEGQIKQQLAQEEKTVAKLRGVLNEFTVELAKKQTVLSDTITKGRKETQTLINQKINEISAINESIKRTSAGLAENKVEAEGLEHQIAQKSELAAKLLDEKKKLTLAVSDRKLQLGLLSNELHPLTMQLNTFEIKSSELEMKIQEWKCHIDMEVAIPEGFLLKSHEFHQNRLNAIAQMKLALGAVNLRAIEKYQTINQRFEELKFKNEQVIEEREAILAFIESLENEKLRVFMSTFNAINANFGYVFSKLSPGGEAKLEVEVPEDPFSGGVEILARPGEKKWCLTQAMSGGEKTLTIIALILGVQMHVPSPYYILDEIDAALDDVNAALVADMIKELSAKSQFVIITHRDVTMARVDHLLGVSNIEGITSVINLSINNILHKLKSEETAVESG